MLPHSVVAADVTVGILTTIYVVFAIYLFYMFDRMLRE